MSKLLGMGEHYNARGLTPETIADSFVSSRQFRLVAAMGNSVLVGPRGSGKTTLLKMLDPRALHRWKHRNDIDAGTELPDFVGVFVPIDTAWINSLNTSIAGSQHDEPPLFLRVYALSTMRALVDIMRWRLSEQSGEFGLKVSRHDLNESKLVELLSDAWFAGTRPRSLLDLRLHISKEILVLPTKWDEIRNREQQLANPLLAVATACDAFNQLAGEPDRKWALLCDELEIAPPPVQQMLFAGLRAVPQPLILKLAFTPKQKVSSSKSGEQPLPANDYEVISLSYPTREEGSTEADREEFCRALWQSLVAEHALPDSLLNPFKVIEGPAKHKSGVRKHFSDRYLDDSFGRIFRELAAKDSSFLKYLTTKHINYEHLDDNDQLKKDSVIRKVRPIVEVRNFNLKADADDRLVRVSRRAPTLYCGARRVFAVSEGHPRWLKYTLTAMLSRAKSGSEHISVAIQNREILNAVQRIDARIKALPAKSSSTEEFIATVGAFFSEQVLGPSFRPDPSLSFIVDTGVPEDMMYCVEQALYVGALVPLQSDVFKLFTDGLSGRRFRLSNWLAPMFDLPLMTGKATNLSTILNKARDSRSATDDVFQSVLSLE